MRTVDDWARAAFASTGPRHGGRGNARPLEAARQWWQSFNGAAPRGARKCEREKRARGFRLASTGPRHGGRGNYLESSAMRAVTCASTGPRHGGRGNRGMSADTKPSRSASTGPRHGGRGNVPDFGRCSAVHQSFNGAAPRGARKLAEGRQGTGRGARLQRGRATGGAEIREGQSQRARHGDASTGPRHGGRGNPPRSATAPQFPSCFNGAAPRGARKSTPDKPKRVCSVWLQRGRATGGAEIAWT